MDPRDWLDLRAERGVHLLPVCVVESMRQHDLTRVVLVRIYMAPSREPGKGKGGQAHDDGS
jgi:hypothetical protein